MAVAVVLVVVLELIFYYKANKQGGSGSDSGMFYKTHFQAVPVQDLIILLQSGW